MTIKQLANRTRFSATAIVNLLVMLESPFVVHATSSWSDPHVSVRICTHFAITTAVRYFADMETCFSYAISADALA